MGHGSGELDLVTQRKLLFSKITVFGLELSCSLLA
jgi:hypothetical protein